MLTTAIFYFVYQHFHLSRFITLESIKKNQEELLANYQAHKMLFVLVYTALFSLSCLTIIPLFYVILNIVAGYIFGINLGLIIASVVNFYCSYLTFVLVRMFFRRAAERHFQKTLRKINKHMKYNGVLYIFLMRAVPALPVLVSNIVISLTRMNIWLYILISQIAIMPELLLTLYAGKKLQEIHNIHEIMNPKAYVSVLLLLFLGVGIYWLINHYIVVKARRQQEIENPKKKEGPPNQDPGAV